MRFFFFLLLFFACAHAYLLSPTFYTTNEIRISNRAIAVSPSPNARLYKLSSNSTHGVLTYFSRDAVTGALTKQVAVASSTSNYVQPFAVGCNDVKASLVAVYLICLSTVVNASLTVPSRIMSIHPTTLALMNSYDLGIRAVSTALPGLGRLSIFFSPTTSLAAAHGNAGFLYFQALPVDGIILPSATPTNFGSVPNSDGVAMIESSLFTWGRTPVPNVQFKANKRSPSTSAIDNGIGSTVVSAYQDIANMAISHGVGGTSLNVYSVEKNATATVFGFRTYQLAYTLVAGSLKPFITNDVSNPTSPWPEPNNASRSLIVCADDYSVYAQTESSLYEFARSSNTNAGVPSGYTAFSRNMSDAFGVVCSSDGLFVYVGNSDGVTRWARDALTTTPSLTLPLTATRYGNLRIAYTLPETALVGTIFVRYTGSTTYTLTMSNSQTQNLSISASSVVANSGGAVTSISGGSSVAEGTYSVTLLYMDQYGNPEATSPAISSVTIDFTTTAPTLTAPQSSATYSTHAILLEFTFAEAMTSSQIFWVRSSGSIVRWTVSSLTAGTKMAAVDAQDVAESGILSTADSPYIDGVYDVYMTAIDSLLNPAANSSIKTGVIVRAYTRRPTWTSPQSEDVLLTTTNTWIYFLPTPATVGTVKMTFTSSNYTGVSPKVLTMAYTGGQEGSQSRTFNSLNPTAGGDVTSATGAVVPGEYTVRIEMQDDTFFNPVNYTDIYNVVLGKNSLLFTHSGIESDEIYETISLNITAPLALQNGLLTLFFTNSNYTHNLTVRGTTLNFYIYDWAISTNQVNISSGGSVLSIDVAIPAQFLNQAFNVSVFATDHLGRFTLSQVLATNVILSEPFCSVRYPCGSAELACAERCDIATECPDVVEFIPEKRMIPDTVAIALMFGLLFTFGALVAAVAALSVLHKTHRYQPISQK